MTNQPPDITSMVQQSEQILATVNDTSDFLDKLQADTADVESVRNVFNQGLAAKWGDLSSRLTNVSDWSALGETLQQVAVFGSQLRQAVLSPRVTDIALRLSLWQSQCSISTSVEWARFIEDASPDELDDNATQVGRMTVPQVATAPLLTLLREWLLYQLGEVAAKEKRPEVLSNWLTSVIGALLSARDLDSFLESARKAISAAQEASVRIVGEHWLKEKTEALGSIPVRQADLQLRQVLTSYQADWQALQQKIVPLLPQLAALSTSEAKLVENYVRSQSVQSAGGVQVLIQMLQRLAGCSIRDTDAVSALYSAKTTPSKPVSVAVRAVWESRLPKMRLGHDLDLTEYLRRAEEAEQSLAAMKQAISNARQYLVNEISRWQGICSRYDLTVNAGDLSEIALAAKTRKEIVSMHNAVLAFGKSVRHELRQGLSDGEAAVLETVVNLSSAGTNRISASDLLNSVDDPDLGNILLNLSKRNLLRVEIVG